MYIFNFIMYYYKYFRYLEGYKISQNTLNDFSALAKATTL